MAEPWPSDLEAAWAAAGASAPDPRTLHYFADVASTNDIAMTLADAGAEHGTAVLADVQRAGRGRRGRTWFSPSGAGVYLSVVVRPGNDPTALSLTTIAAGVAGARAIQQVTGLAIQLKWPNDFVIGRPWRKLGGVLCEAVGGSPAIAGVVVGIGINVLATAYPSELRGRATSLDVELGRAIDRAPLVVALLMSVVDVMTRLRAGGHAWVCDEWRRYGRTGLGGAPVSWADALGTHRGGARDIAPDGALLVDVGGRIERVIAGEVMWE